MSSKIKILDEETASQIAAGEVAERPAAIVKELIENSVDADTSRIVIKVLGGGLERIQIIDNGRGMNAEEIPLSVERHATSKIRAIGDLSTIETLGFRGEALASIAAISRLEIISRPPENLEGYSLLVAGGKKESLQEVGCPSGTSITIDELFYNVPARKKFMKSPVAEMGKITELVEKMALSRPDIAFILYNDQKITFRSPGGGDLYKAAQVVYGSETTKQLLALEWTERILLLGLISLPELNRSNRNYYNFFINSRWVKSPQLSQLVDEVYHTLIPHGRYPVVILHLQINPALLDVNVHPAKMEIKFADFASIQEALQKAIRQALMKQDRIIPRLICGKPSLLDPLPHMEEAFRLDERQRPVLQERQPGQTAPEAGELPELAIAWQREEMAAKLGFKANNPEDTLQNEEDAARHIQPDPMAITGRQEKLFLPEERKNREESFFFASLHPLGQFSATYIVAAGEDKLYLIDQHAAHERIRYEAYKRRFYAGQRASNILAVPVPLELTGMEKAVLLQNIISIRDWGWIIEDFGDNTCLLRGTPSWLAEDTDPVDLLRSLLSEQKGDKEMNESKLFLQACRSSVKAHDYLTHADMAFILNELDQVEQPYTCPHGRPIITSISLAEIEKKFYRSSI